MLENLEKKRQNEITGKEERVRSKKDGSEGEYIETTKKMTRN